MMEILQHHQIIKGKVNAEAYKDYKQEINLQTAMNPQR